MSHLTDALVVKVFAPRKLVRTSIGDLRPEGHELSEQHLPLVGGGMPRVSKTIGGLPDGGYTDVDDAF